MTATSTDAAALASVLRDNLGLKCPRSRTRYGAWKHLAVTAQGESDWMPYSVVVAMNGIDFAFNTGRLDHTITDQIKALNDWHLCALLADVAANCYVSGEVPGYLINRYVGQEPTARA